MKPLHNILPFELSSIVPERICGAQQFFIPCVVGAQRDIPTSKWRVLGSFSELPSMACKLPPSPSLSRGPPWIQALERSPTRSHGVLIKPSISSDKCVSPCRATQSEKLTDETSSTGSSARNQLDLLEQLTSSTTSETGYESPGETRRPTIREQLAEIVGDRDGDFIIPLGQKLKASLKSLNSPTVSQRRNIKRQSYLNEVGRRNDSVFFATIGAFVLLPPAVILAVAISTGYVQLFP